MDGKTPVTKGRYESIWARAAPNAAVARKHEMILRRTRGGDGNDIGIGSVRAISCVDAEPIGVCLAMVPFGKVVGS